MHRPHLVVVLVLSAAVSAGLQAGAERPSPDGLEAQQAEQTLLVGRVEQIHPPRLLIVGNRLADARQVLVLLPEGSSPQPTGTMVYARGVLRRVDQAQVGQRAWGAMDERSRREFAGRPVLIAESVDSPDTSPTGISGPPLPVPVRVAARRELILRPAALASLIGEVAGFNVRVPYARVVGLFDSQSFLIDTAAQIPESFGFRDRVLVLLDGAKLRMPAEDLVASTVTVEGVARTLLGVQAAADVPWPSRLNRDAVKRLEVRAVVLATSVRTADGVELTDRPRNQ
jgi:hypothetical protein